MPKTYARFDLRLVKFPWPRWGQEFALALIFKGPSLPNVPAFTVSADPRVNYGTRKGNEA